MAGRDAAAPDGAGSWRSAPTVLRLCSVFEPPPAALSRPDAAAFDPIGGMQNHTASLTRQLDELGVRQLVVTSRLGGPAARSRLGRHAEVVRTGFPVRRWRQLWAVTALARGLRATRLALVHAHQGEDLAVLPLGVLLARRAGVPLVVTLHCSLTHTVERRGAVGRFGPIIERWALRRAAAVLVLTPRARAALVTDGVEPDRVHVVPSGFVPEAQVRAGASALDADVVVRADQVRAGASALDAAVVDVADQVRAGASALDAAVVDVADQVRSGASALDAAVVESGPDACGEGDDPLPGVPHPRVLFAGRLAEQKKPVDAVLAHALMRTEAQLVVVGDGPLRPQVEAAVAASPARERVHLVGLVPHEQVAAYLTSADVFVLPACYEELGSVLVEAMACGLPVVANRVGGIPDLVEDLVTGRLVERGDLPGLAVTLDEVLDDAEGSALLAKRARALVEADYAWPGLARRVLAVYEAVAGEALSDRRNTPNGADAESRPVRGGAGAACPVATPR